MSMLTRGQHCNLYSLVIEIIQAIGLYHAQDMYILGLAV